MIEVFKTEIKDDHEALLVRNCLERRLGYRSCSVDLEDCDSVLRVVADQIESMEVLKVLSTLNIKCEILED